jgi:hypothetical protein
MRITGPTGNRFSHRLCLRVHLCQALLLDATLIAIEVKVARIRTRRAARHLSHHDIVGWLHARACAERIQCQRRCGAFCLLGCSCGLLFKQLLHITKSFGDI